jgi:hypothetical protein
VIVCTSYVLLYLHDFASSCKPLSLVLLSCGINSSVQQHETKSVKVAQNSCIVAPCMLQHDTEVEQCCVKQSIGVVMSMSTALYRFESMVCTNARIQHDVEQRCEQLMQKRAAI